MTLAWKTHKTCKIRDKIGTRNRKVDSILIIWECYFNYKDIDLFEDDLLWSKVFSSSTTLSKALWLIEKMGQMSTVSCLQWMWEYLSICNQLSKKCYQNFYISLGKAGNDV